MNEQELKAMPPAEVVQYAKDIGLNTKGKNPSSLIPLILKRIEGEPSEGDVTGESTADTASKLSEALGGDALPDPTPEEIIAQESELLDEEDSDAPPVNLDAMTEEEILMHQITVAENTKAHPAILTALYNAYERLTAVPEQAPEQQITSAADHPQVHTANQQHTGRPPKAGSHWPTPEEAISMLGAYTKRGLVVTRVPKIPHMLLLKHAGRECAITLKQPLRTILQHAGLLMRPTGKPTEDLSYEELVDLRHKALKK